jgi:hypothetical protein
MTMLDNVEDFIAKCKKRGITQVMITIAYRIDNFTQRVATFDWSAQAMNKNSKSPMGFDTVDGIKYMDKKSECWFDDGYPLPIYSEGAMIFNGSESRKGTQFERMGAFFNDIKRMEEANFNFSFMAHDTEAIFQWLDIVVTCLSDPSAKEDMENEIRDLTRVRTR